MLSNKKDQQINKLIFSKIKDLIHIKQKDPVCLCYITLERDGIFCRNCQMKEFEDEHRAS